MAGGTWEPTGQLPVRPGLYTRFLDAAIQQIKPGPRGIVAMPILTDKQEPDQVITITSVGEAEALFGAENIRAIRLAFLGGAKKILLFTIEKEPKDNKGVNRMCAQFEKRVFNVYVHDSNLYRAHSNPDYGIKNWITSNREVLGNHFIGIFGTEDTPSQTANKQPNVGAKLAVDFKDDYIVQLSNGAEWNGETLDSIDFAPYIAGVIAGTPLNKSITYHSVPVDTVDEHYTDAQIKEKLKQGLLILREDRYNKVLIEKGIVTTGEKIRSIRVRQAIPFDIRVIAEDAYIGKVNNDSDGRAAVIAAISSYLEKLENYQVLTDYEVTLDPNYHSRTGEYEPDEADTLYLRISYREIDAIERVFITVTV
ncbi:phage tail sheath C-terminal domain-containing protein [Longirhabdus pacifica]|uniref:phage tail sheath C-terminal domain-containing protein n=1 Tax=Longirhabdus pacifica TaxID=2305227 RepID=UPI001009357D|nr:phage tail sheath C-terminal domain-containing protein [Longirhabdus pacifica]